MAVKGLTPAEVSAQVTSVFAAIDAEKQGLIQAADALEAIFRTGGLLYEQQIPPRQVSGCFFFLAVPWVRDNYSTVQYSTLCRQTFLGLAVLTAIILCRAVSPPSLLLPLVVARPRS